MHPDLRGLPTVSFHPYDGVSPALSPATALTMKPPSVQSPFARSRCCHRHGEACSASSEGVAPPSLLLRTLAPIPLGSPVLRLLPRSRSLGRFLPVSAAQRIFPTLSLRIFPRMLGPLPRRSHRVRLPVSSPVRSEEHTS